MVPKGSISKVYEYYFTTPRYSEEVMRALREFFDLPKLDKGGSLETDEKSEGLFNEWFLYDFILQNGRVVIDDFIIDNPLNLKDIEMELYRNLSDNHYGVFEALEVELGKSITMLDLQTGKKWTVQEFSATYDIIKDSLFFGRIGKVGDHYELIGADTFSLQGVSEEIKKSFRKMKLKLKPKIARELWAGK